MHVNGVRMIAHHSYARRVPARGAAVRSEPVVVNIYENSDVYSYAVGDTTNYKLWQRGFHVNGPDALSALRSSAAQPRSLSSSSRFFSRAPSRPAPFPFLSLLSPSQAKEEYEHSMAHIHIVIRLAYR